MLIGYSPKRDGENLRSIPPEVDSITRVANDRNFELGKFYNILITEAGAYDLGGSLFNS